MPGAFIDRTAVLVLLAFLASLFSLAWAQSASFRPPALPLAVKSPYLNSWLNTGASNDILTYYPRNWNAKQILGWLGYIRVDGDSYVWLGNKNGNPGMKASLQGIEVTPTRSVMSLRAGNKVDLNITFLNPIEPDDLALQSFPFSYVYIDVSSHDGQDHSVQLYCDLSGEWLTADVSNQATWNTTVTNDVVYHTAQRRDPEPMTERKGIAEDGALFLGALKESGASYSIGSAGTLRSQFSSQGSLDNKANSTSGALGPSPFMTFAHAKDLGTVRNVETAAVWAVGLVRDPSIAYSTSSGDELRRSLFWSKYESVEKGITDFLQNFGSAKQRAIELDERILGEAGDISDNYPALMGYTSRAVFGSLEITFKDDPNDILVFMKAMGNDATARRASPVATMLAAFPSLMYYNAKWGRYLLEPHLRYQASSSRGYAIGDLGTSFPNAMGNGKSPVANSLDDTASLLIMTWAQSKFSGDKTLIDNYYNLLKSWADYLISHNAATPDGYQDSDGLNSSNMTNLALKGILGVSAMGNIAAQSDNADTDADRDKYVTQATTWIEQWHSSASAEDHLSGVYGRPDKEALIYNLFLEKWLDLGIVSEEVYQNQTAFYSRQFSSSVASDYGIQYSSDNPDIVRSHWMMFTAATCTQADVRNEFIDAVYHKMTDGNGGFFPTSWFLNGSWAGDAMGPSHGATFSLLALNQQSSLDSWHASGDPSYKSKAGAIAGGVVGGLALICLIVGGFFLWRRRRLNQQAKEAEATRVSAWTPGNNADSAAGVPLLPSQSQSPLSSQLPIHRPESGPSTPYFGSFGAAADSRMFEARKERLPPGSEAGMSLHAEQSSASGGPSGSLNESASDPDPLALQREVQDLRREMEEMRNQGVYGPPPQYH